MKNLILILASLALLSACGGGGGSSDNQQAAAPAAEVTSPTETPSDTRVTPELDSASESEESSATETLSDTNVTPELDLASETEESMETRAEADLAPEIDSAPETEAILETQSASESEPVETDLSPEVTTVVRTNQLTTISLTRSAPLVTSENQSTSTENATKSAEIVVPEGFNLTSQSGYKLSIDHPHQGTVAYLSVCKDFKIDEKDELVINYESCMIRTSIQHQAHEMEFNVPNEVEHLAAALWFLDDTIEPVSILWQLSNIQ